jgi:MYXO-CTERM domain-containing protein
MPRSAARRLPAVLPLLVLVACGAGEEAGEAARPIVNGDLTHSYPSAGALLTGAGPESSQLQCSGTLIGCDSFLTAAHCVCPGDGSDCQSPTPVEPMRVFFQHAGFFEVTAVRVHPAFSFPDNDVAILTLERPVAGITPTPLQDSAPALGTQGTIVGFGRTGGSDFVYGLKYEGPVTTGTCPESVDPTGKVCWTFNGTGDANTCNGDSGGPLYFTIGGVTRVGGITSGGEDASCLAGDNSYDNDVFTYKAFIEAGTPIAQASCGALPHIGSPAVDVESDQGRLDGGESTELTVDVPRGTTELRVALNSSDGGAANFDLAVHRGGVRDEAMSCTAATPSPYEYCHVSSPEPDVWTVEVEALGGGGQFQVVATVVGGGPVGVDDAYTAFGGRALEIDAGDGVLANDEAPLGALSAEVVSAPLHGELALAGDGSFVYTAEESYTGTDTFEYRASDGSYSTGGVVVVTVEPASAAPDEGGVFGGCAAGGSGSPWATALVLVAALALVVRRRQSWGQ